MRFRRYIFTVTSPAICFCRSADGTRIAFAVSGNGPAGWGREDASYRQMLAMQFIPGGTLEERDLLKEHGASYASYRERVPMLVPGTKGRGKAPPKGLPRRSDRGRRSR